MERPFARLRRRPPADPADAAHRIFAAALDGLFLTDLEGRVTAWSPGAERTFGRPAREVLGFPAAAIAGGDWAERLPHLLRDVLAGAPFRHEELCGKRGDGAGICVDLVLSPVRDAQGDPTGVVGVARETGARRHREGRLVEIARMSTAGEILAGLAHEVNQPLTSIASYAGACQNLVQTLSGSAVERVRSHLRQIVEQTAAAAEILRRARRFVRRSGEPVSFDLAELAGEAVALLRFEASRRQVVVEVSAGAPVIVRADRLQIEQVMVNLLRNSYESFAPEAEDRRVRVRIGSDGTNAAVQIEDNGTGIPARDPRVYDTFYTTKADGLGLGLGICRTILERHGGRLAVAAGPRGGTTAGFTLPLPERREGDA